MTDFDDGTPRYPMLKLVVQHGRRASAVLAAALLCTAIGLAVALGSIGIGILGATLAALSYVLARILVELVSLITDMLLPQ